MHAATLIVLIVAAGIGSQWLAAQLKLPGILVMIGAGLTLGPLTGLIDIHLEGEELAQLIGLGVAIILFEGAMDLRVAEFRAVGAEVRRLTLIGPPLAWLLGTLAGHYAAGLTWASSAVLGAILVVTGPTVILPLLRQARLNKTTSSLLKWEGIVNDPIGVLLAVVTFQFVTVADEGAVTMLARTGLAIAAAAVLGGVGGWAMTVLYRRGWVPPHLKAPLLMAAVLVVSWASNAVQHESGLLAVTVMGLVVGNAPLVERERILHFKESLTVVLLAMIFIVIPSTLSLDDLRALDWRAAAFVAAILVIVRPASIWLATLRSPMRWQDRALLGWIAPRGIVAAATAGIFGPALVARGYSDADALLPLVFTVIVVTVLAHGLTLGPLARRWGLAASARNGLLLVGASPFSQALGAALREAGVDVLVADGSYRRLKPLRLDETPVWVGEVLSDHAEHGLDVSHLSFVLAATENDYYNALVCRAQTGDFGSAKVFQVPMQEEARHDNRRLPLQKRGHFAFDRESDFATLQGHLDQGWEIRTTALTDKFGPAALEQQLGAHGEDWMLLGAISPSGALRVHSQTHPVTPKAGWRAIVFAPAHVRTAPTETAGATA